MLCGTGQHFLQFFRPLQFAWLTSIGFDLSFAWGRCWWDVFETR